MNRINEYNIEPGEYQHYQKGMYVVLNLITHLPGKDGKMEELADPLVAYRDLELFFKHVNGKRMAAHQVYGLPLSKFFGLVDHNGEIVKRFRKV